MSEDLTPRLIEEVRELLRSLRGDLDGLAGAVKDLRADLKRREARDLENAGRIPKSRKAAAEPTAPTAFPNYGRRKNEPIRDADLSDLDYYKAGCHRTLDDPNRSHYHASERVLLAVIEAEIARQQNAELPLEDGDADVPF